MAGSFPQKKHHHVLIPILFFTSFFLIILALLSSERTLHLFLPPSLYRDLFSNTTSSTSSSHSLISPIISPDSNTSILVDTQVPISEGVSPDTEFIGEKAENGSAISPISERVPTDWDTTPDTTFNSGGNTPLIPEFNGGKVEYGTKTVPISKGVPAYSEYSGGKEENEATNVHISVPTDSKFDVINEENDARNIPISERVPKDPKFDGRNEENGDETVSFHKEENLSFVNGSGNVGGVVIEEEMKRGKRCNLYMGKWIRDDEYPVYQPGSCPYVDEAFDCQSNGRPDSKYLRWRWKPDDCGLPKYNATDFLVRLQGKRLMLVGDSMNRNQFESILCLLRMGLPDKSKMYEVHGYKITKGRGFYIFKFVDFNCTVEFVRSHFLVKEGTHINGQGNSNPTLSIDKIDKTARKWRRADILIFNTGHWWTHGKTSRGKNYFKEGDQIYPRFDAVEAYRRSLKTWAEWVDKNVNPARQLVFYRAYSSAHFRGGDWDSGGTCNGETEPILGGTFLDNYPIKMKIVEEVTQQMRVPVILLNVTRLTNFRKDGHPSVYGKVRTSGAKVSGRKQDCSHWCLPGVPDAWNELIYATLVLQQTGIDHSTTLGS